MLGLLSGTCCREMCTVWGTLGFFCGFSKSRINNTLGFIMLCLQQQQRHGYLHMHVWNEAGFSGWQSAEVQAEFRIPHPHGRSQAVSGVTAGNGSGRGWGSGRRVQCADHDQWTEPKNTSVRKQRRIAVISRQGSAAVAVECSGNATAHQRVCLLSYLLTVHLRTSL